jgi:RND family efflux transporter MFP subunit
VFKRRSIVIILSAMGCFALASCARREVSAKTKNEESAIEVGTTPVIERSIGRHLTVSSEFVPFQEIDVYAKEAGYVNQIFVDYGSHVHAGQLLATLEIPELEASLQVDEASIRAQTDEVMRADREVNRAKAQYNALHLQYSRLASVAKTQAGLVAQQEVDDAQGKDLAQESQVEASQGARAAAEGQLAMAKAKLTRDQDLYAYSKITAPFDGIITQRYANLGALMQAGTTSTQATPLVKLSQENLFRLVIPVPESYVKYIHIGDPVEVRVPSLGRDFQGKVTRFSIDVKADTRTMHTEVDVPNPGGQLIPGLYAEAILPVDQKANALVVPVQAVNHEADKTTVFVVNRSNRLEDRPITIGQQSDNYAEVDGGLSLGEQIVVSERSGLKAGQLVRSKQVAPLVYEGSGKDDEGSK